MLSLYYSMEADRLGMVAAANDVALPARRPLTRRQVECLQWIAEGKSAWDISQILNLSQYTVNEHLAAARRSLGVKTTTQAVVRAVQSGAVLPPCTS
jgi:DNA-binding CsgD family transcriptional regulator